MQSRHKLPEQQLGQNFVATTPEMTDNDQGSKQPEKPGRDTVAVGKLTYTSTSS